MTLQIKNLVTSQKENAFCQFYKIWVNTAKDIAPRSVTDRQTDGRANREGQFLELLAAANNLCDIFYEMMITVSVMICFKSNTLWSRKCDSNLPSIRFTIVIKINDYHWLPPANFKWQAQWCEDSAYTLIINIRKYHAGFRRYHVESGKLNMWYLSLALNKQRHQLKAVLVSLDLFWRLI